MLDPLCLLALFGRAGARLCAELCARPGARSGARLIQSSAAGPSLNPDLDLALGYGFSLLKKQCLRSVSGLKIQLGILFVLLRVQQVLSLFSWFK